MHNLLIKNLLKHTLMKKSNVLVLAAFLMLFTIVGCSKNDDNSTVTATPEPEPTAILKVTLNGLEPLSETYVYEGWIMVNGNPVSTGTFNTTTGTTIKEFSVLESNLDVATAFILSIELAENDPQGPSDTKILKGEFLNNSTAASLKTDSVIGNFADTSNPFSGSFVNKTPSDNIGNNDQYGIWFIQNPTAPTAGLINLPTLSAGWKYEGWVIFSGPTPVTTGKFTSASGVDLSSPYSGNEAVPAFPGEDFVQNLPTGVTGDTTGLDVVISIEPNFPTDPNEPFFLKPITGTQGPNTLSVTTDINVLINGTAVKQ